MYVASENCRDLTSSRKHLTSAHFKDRCTRCQKEFSLSSELMMHYRRCPHAPGSPSRMGTQNSDPENGFGETVDSQLRSRGANQNIKEWAHLWNALFPEDENIPDHSITRPLSTRAVAKLTRNRFRSCCRRLRSI